MRVFDKAVVTLCIAAILFGMGVLAAAPAGELDDRQTESREAFGLGSRLAQSGEPSAAPKVMEPASVVTVKVSPKPAAAPAPRQPAKYGPELPPDAKPAVDKVVGTPKLASHARRTSHPVIVNQSAQALPVVPVGVREYHRDGTQDRRQDKIALLAGRSENRVSTREAVGKTASTVGIMVLKLAFVLALAYATILVLKWVSAKRESRPSGSRDLQVVDTVRLSPTSSLHLVSASGRTLLVGCASGQVNLLREFELGEAPEDVEATGGKFAEYLEKYSGGNAASTPAARIAGLLRDCTAHLRRHQARHVSTRSTDEGRCDAS